jgi:NTP pyrophosphatase (non-canonical NTP hydrolase)
MNPNTYQEQALRTVCPQTRALKRIENRPYGSQILHAVIGLTGEVGELASAVEKFAYYEQRFDSNNVVEEIGDCLWYLAELCDAIGISLETCMDLNLAKLKSRYPEKFSQERAKEENRDRQKELKDFDPTDPQDLYRFISQREINKILAEDDGPRYED